MWEYLEHYKLDYTLSIFIPEANLKDTPIDWNEVAREAGVQSTIGEPLLVSLIKHGKNSQPAAKGKSQLEPIK